MLMRVLSAYSHVVVFIVEPHEPCLALLGGPLAPTLVARELSTQNESGANRGRGSEPGR
jgi:hypothetical protein